jgi:hypothetical protein
MLFFGEKFPGEKGSVRQCVVMMQQPVLLSPNSGVVFTHFHTVDIKHHSSTQN